MKSLLYTLIVVSMVGLLIPLSANAEEISVNSYYGEYDATMKKSGFPSASLKEPVVETWKTPTPKKQYRIGVLFPHHKDSYWIAANYGIFSHAGELGIDILLHEAGGYIRFGHQKTMLTALAKSKKVDGIVLASLDYTKMDKFVEEVVDNGVPVIELINDILAPKIKAKSLVSFNEMGYKAGEFVIRDSEGKDMRIAFFPGPENSGWAPETYEGFKASVSKNKKPGQQITILEPAYGDTRSEVQRMRLQSVLSRPENYRMDYIVGNAVACAEAVGYLRKNRHNHPDTKIVSTYITIEVYEQIKQGKIIASPSDKTIHQCIVALDMMVRLLNGEQPGKDFPFRTGPVIPVITKDNMEQYPYENLFGKKDYVPVVHRFEK